MATVTTTLKISSSDLATNTLALTTAATQSPNASTGLARDTITATTQKATLTVADGDANHGMSEAEYVIITDAAGLKRVYVLVETASDATSVATGDVITAGADTGAGALSTTIAALGTCIAVDVNQSGGTRSQNDVLVDLKAAIEHANGHNGSITVSAVPTQADGAQSIELTHAAGIQGGISITEAVTNLTAVATNGQVKVQTLGEFTSPSYLYLKNTATNAAHYVYIYNEVNQNIVLQIAGGQFAFLPMLATDRYMAYTSNSGTVVEYMAWGTSA